MFESLTEAIESGPIGYLIVFAGCVGDVIFPVLPSESLVITAGVLAADGGLSLWLIILVAAVGALIGDNIVYWLGRTVGEPVAHRFFKGEKGRARLERAEDSVRRNGASLVAAGRFIPGGRTASTFAAGLAHYPYSRFIVVDLIAVVAWATLGASLGYAGGRVFEDSQLLALGVSFGVGLLVVVLIEVGRRALAKRRPTPPSSPHPARGDGAPR